MLAICLLRLDAPPNILQMYHRFQMSRIDTKWDAAEMIQLKPLGNGSY